jgi:hypothetical protein
MRPPHVPATAACVPEVPASSSPRMAVGVVLRDGAGELLTHGVNSVGDADNVPSSEGLLQVRADVSGGVQCGMVLAAVAAKQCVDATEPKPGEIK